LTFAFIREVVIVTIPASSVTLKLVVPHALLTDRDVLAGMEEAVVYCTLIISSLQTCILILPVFIVNVTPLESEVYDVTDKASTFKVLNGPVPEKIMPIIKRHAKIFLVILIIISPTLLFLFKKY
jgi:hypothetical protein